MAVGTLCSIEAILLLMHNTGICFCNVERAFPYSVHFQSAVYRGRGGGPAVRPPGVAPAAAPPPALVAAPRAALCRDARRADVTAVVIIKDRYLFICLFIYLFPSPAVSRRQGRTCPAGAASNVCPRRGFGGDKPKQGVKVPALENGAGRGREEAGLRGAASHRSPHHPTEPQLAALARSEAAPRNKGGRDRTPPK